MKTLYAQFVLLGAGCCFLEMSTPSRAEAPQEKTRLVLLQITPEIDCSGCEDRLQHLLEATQGVRQVELDVMESRVRVRFDPGQCSVGRLLGRVAATGYTAKEVPK